MLLEVAERHGHGITGR